MDIHIETDGTEVLLSGLITDAILTLTVNQARRIIIGATAAKLPSPHTDVVSTKLRKIHIPFHVVASV